MDIRQKSSMRNAILIVLIAIVAILLIWKLFSRDINLMGKATLNWNASTETEVAGYKVYYGTQKRTDDCPQGGYIKKVDVGNKNFYQLSNLENNKTYYFSVTSYNAGGKESCFSQEMQKTIKLNLWDKLKTFFNK